MNVLYQHCEKLFPEILPYIIAHRRHLHACPELSGKEFKTSAYIIQTLESIGIGKIQQYENLGITAVIEGNQKGPVIGLRAEMDALPIEEANDTEYVSQNPGVMHACGHDVHMALLLGVASVFFRMKDQLPFSIKLIFQPSEETLPGGALEMINKGVLSDPQVDFMLGFHVLPEMEAGKTGIKPGNYMASGDEIYLTLFGKGGHAAMPHLLNDPVVCAANIITTMQQIISRKASPDIPTVLSFGRFIANGRTNVVPDVVEIEGTFRTFDETWRLKAHRLIEDIARNTAQSADIVADLRIIKGYPVLYNNPELTSDVKSVFQQTMGKTNVIDLPLRMTADDFAYYTHQVPSCYFRIGAGFPGNSVIRNLHTPLFDIHPETFSTGLKAIVSAVSAAFLKSPR